MNFKQMLKGIPGLALMAAGGLLTQVAVEAQQSDSQTLQVSQANPGQPARAVRLSYVDGQVKLSQGDQVLADHAVANTPLFEGAQLTTGDDGKAEIQFEDGSVARIAPDSSLTLQVLRGAGNSAEAELNVNAGLAYFEFQGSGQAGQLSVHFGSSTATTSGFTSFRISFDTPPGSLSVFSGNVHLEIASSFGSGVTADLHGGENIALNPADSSNYSLAESIDQNSWDAWNADRDDALNAEASSQTGAPEEMAEAQSPALNDLDASGAWYDVPGQGYVWSPYDAANDDFDPYGSGDWIYSPGYGYVWASGYSWGYLPFHCGAWNFYDGFGWGWAPGAGGCSPWWNGGFYAGPNIGIAPAGYRPLPRPLPPHWPIGHRPIPMIPVRRPAAATNHPFTAASGRFPARNGDTQVTIAGSIVRPVPTRPTQTSIGGQQEFHPVHGSIDTNGNNHPPTYMGSHPAGTAATRPGYVPPQPSRADPRPVPPNRGGAPPPSAPRSAPNSAPPSHTSGANSGGGSPHVSAAGGGGTHSGGHR